MRICTDAQQQILYSHIQTVVNTFPAGATRQKYATAAANFRLPYWDWAATPCSTCKAFPILVSQQYVTVTTPSGQQSIMNPLFRYDFHPISASDMVYNPVSAVSPPCILVLLIEYSLLPGHGQGVTQPAGMRQQFRRTI